MRRKPTNTRQEIEGEQAYVNGKGLAANPYSPTKQPEYYRRWLKGYLETKRLLVT